MRFFVFRVDDVWRLPNFDLCLPGYNPSRWRHLAHIQSRTFSVLDLKSLCSEMGRSTGLGTSVRDVRVRQTERERERKREREREKEREREGESMQLDGMQCRVGEEHYFSRWDCEDTCFCCFSRLCGTVGSHVCIFCRLCGTMRTHFFHFCMLCWTVGTHVCIFSRLCGTVETHVCIFPGCVGLWRHMFVDLYFSRLCGTKDTHVCIFSRLCGTVETHVCCFSR